MEFIVLALGLSFKASVLGPASERYPVFKGEEGWSFIRGILHGQNRMALRHGLSRYMDPTRLSDSKDAMHGCGAWFCYNAIDALRNARKYKG